MKNVVNLIGHLGAKPEIRTTQSGKEVVSMSLATSKRWKDQTTGEKKEKTQWHKLVSFSSNHINLAKNYLDKGALLDITGELEYSHYLKDGIKHHKTEITLEKIIMLDKKDSEEAAATEAETQEIDEVPFD